MSRCAAAVSLAFFFLFVGSAAEAWQSSHPSGGSPPSVTVTGEDNGKDVDLATGVSLIVKLKSNPSTGYSWTVSGDPSPLRLEKSSYVKSSPSSKTVGASGMQVLRLSANSSGVATLTVIYRRSWEYNMPPARTFSLRVNIR